MIKYYRHNEIDKAKWDECIDKSPNGIVYAYSWYLDQFCDHWDALIKDDYEAVFPLPWKQKLGIKYIYQPVFIQQLGIFSLVSSISKSLIKDFLDAIPPHFKALTVNLNTANEIEQYRNFNITKRITYHLDLNKDYTELFNNYSADRQRNLKKAKKQSLKLSKETNPSKLFELLKSENNLLYKVVPDVAYNNLKQLMNLSFQKGLGELWSIYDVNNTYCGGAYFIKAHQKSIYLFSFTNKNGRKSSAMTLLIDQYIKNNANTNLILDFEGSMIPDIASFYAGFGATAVCYYQIQKNNFPIYLKILFFLKKLIK